MNGMALFAGAGGLELGLKLALGNAYRTVCVVEREAYAAAHLVARMEAGELDQAPIWDDVSTFDGGPWRGVVDIVSGGFPCQDISSAGQRAGIFVGKRSGLWFDMARTIRDVDPEWVFVENVDALVVRGLDIVLWTLAEMGFDAEWGVLGADECGAPHQRDRAFILAHANSHGQQGEWRQRDESWSHPDGRSRPSGCTVGNAHRAGLEGWQRSEHGSADERTARQTGVVQRGADSGRRRWQDDEVRTGRSRPVRTGQLADSPSTLGEGLERRSPYGDVGCFPPGPNDVLAWWDVPEILEPALCRVAYGMANRVDDLRACGNGVVPVAAAVAFLALRERLAAR